MVDALPPLEGSLLAALPRTASTGAGRTDFAPAARAAEPEPIPASPPPEVLDALDTAARVLDELHRKQVELRFEREPGSKQIRVLVEDGEGQVVREIPQRTLLNVLAGDVAALGHGKGSVR